ncbi:PREDICTED: uncharacterized protein LOC108533011 isoform X1 [Rhinopithecus bieti]|uniref:uncharacterized protein LOC108533011 isoform X1 n=1 Tax=Rhinopithecus bieti TaxID=61621 RepID=UPI00083C0654|nr:PREDICTED: uncharacterized protein LOC108533011 isoform X1 [Rhinopithecus bieti]
MAAGGSDPRAGDVEEDASQLIFPKAWRDGLKMRSCSRFLMISRQSAAFSINLQTSLLLGEIASPGVTPPSQALGLTCMEMLLRRTVENSFGENSPAWRGVSLLFQITHRPSPGHGILEQPCAVAASGFLNVPLGSVRWGHTIGYLIHGLWPPHHLFS